MIIIMHCWHTKLIIRLEGCHNKIAELYRKAGALSKLILSHWIDHSPEVLHTWPQHELYLYSIRLSYIHDIVNTHACRIIAYSHVIRTGLDHLIYCSDCTHIHFTPPLRWSHSTEIQQEQRYLKGLKARHKITPYQPQFLPLMIPRVHDHTLL